MDYTQQLRELSADPQQIERLYQTAAATGQGPAFTAAVGQLHTAQPDNLLYAAWRYRLEPAAPAPAAGLFNRWRYAIPISLFSGLLFWLLSDLEQLVVLDNVPLLFFAWGPIAACLIILYLSQARTQGRSRWLGLSVGLAALLGYAIWAAQVQGDWARATDVTWLIIFHIPVLAWLAIAAFVQWGEADVLNQFAFVLKSLEVGITAGLFAIAGGVFTVITFGLFAALDITPPEFVLRLFFVGGGGAIAIFAVAAAYLPEYRPKEQPFAQGLSGLIATIMRVLLPLTLLVLLIYLGFVAFNFMQPFRDRELLIVYNAMLFALMALLVGATPAFAAELNPQLTILLRRGVLAVAVLATLVSLYAVAAVGYRTVLGGLTPNRFAVIGWNVVNIAILILLLINQRRAGPAGWLAAFHDTVRIGLVLYVAWSAVLVLLAPWIFAGWTINTLH